MPRAVLGDSNGDGVFNSLDLTFVFQQNKYEDDVPNNATFADGDWNGDGDFDSRDLVLAFKSGTYLGAAAPMAAPDLSASPQLGVSIFKAHDDEDDAKRPTRSRDLQALDQAFEQL